MPPPPPFFQDSKLQLHIDLVGVDLSPRRGGEDDLRSMQPFPAPGVEDFEEDQERLQGWKTGVEDGGGGGQAEDAPMKCAIL